VLSRRILFIESISYLNFFVKINKLMTLTDIINVVIIRFSVRSKRFNFLKNEEERNSWFIFRANMFNAYLHNCLHHQTKKPNKVYVLVDKDDKNLVGKYLNTDNITVVYCNNEMKYYKEQILVDLCKNKLIKNVVISRIDSDDLINKDFFHNINQQLLFHPTKKLVVCRGYFSDLHKIQSIFYSNSPFISEYINFENNLSKYELEKNLHKFSLFDSCHIGQTECNQNHSAEWIQLIHQTNISNEFADESTNLSGFYSTSLMPLDITWFTNWAGFEFTRIKEYDYVWGHLIASIPFDLQGSCGFAESCFRNG